MTRDVAEAVAALRAGRLVAFPTETVYGLGADADDPAAVARIYAAKGRPTGHPLIVHLAAAGQADDWAVEVPGYARGLAEAFWPGPLTLVLPRSARVGDHVTGGQPTVGLRVPSHPVAHALLAAFGGGVAAPSANRFGRVSPTDAAHVVAELAEVLQPRDVVLDGGPAQVGVESTIVDCTGEVPRLLRPGAVTAADVERVTGVSPAAADGTVRAPGTLPSHYAPTAHVVLADAADVPTAVLAARAPVGLLAPAYVATPTAVSERLGAPADAEAYARTLYASLREADELGLVTVVVVPPDGPGLALAVRDRLRRAAASS